MPNSKSSKELKDYTIDEIKKLFEIKIVMPEDNDNSFDMIIGNKPNVEYFKEIASYFKDGLEIELLGDEFHPAFVLLGIEGIGKTLMTFAFAHEMNLPIIVISTEKLLQDYSARAFKGLTALIKSIGNCVFLLKEVQYIAQLQDNEKCNSAYTQLVSLKNAFPKSFFFVSASATTAYPPFFMGPGGFEEISSFNPPLPDEREALIRKFLEDIPYIENLEIEKLARSCYGLSGGNIKNILKKSLFMTSIKGLDELSYEVINEVLISDTYGSKVRKMSEKEMRITAYHEAGHLIAGYYGCPDYKVDQLEVVYRSETLGITSSEADEEKLSTTKEDIIGGIITCLGGKCAEQIIFKTSTTGVIEDIRRATALADGFICKFGMDESFGPVYVDDDEFYSDTLKATADIKIQEMLIKYEAQTSQILIENKDKLIAVAEALVKKETLYKEEIMEILEGKPQKNSKKGKKSKKS